jgi:hypothetical protein
MQSEQASSQALPARKLASRGTRRGRAGGANMKLIRRLWCRIAHPKHLTTYLPSYGVWCSICGAYW